MQLANIQVALFFKENVLRPDQFFYSLDKGIHDLFDGKIPTIIPLPSEAPAELPIVQMESIGGKIKLNVSKNRVDLFCNVGGNVSFKSAIEQTLKDTINLFCTSVLKQSQIVRVGIIITLFFPCSNSAQQINNVYFKSNDMLSECSLRKNIITNLNQMKLNNITEISDGVISFSDEKILEAVIIMRDINNVVEEGKTLTDDDVSKIIEYAYENAENDLVGVIKHVEKSVECNTFV